MSLVAALPVTDRGFGSFLDEFYGAALEPGRFAGALSAFSAAFDAEEARILVRDRAGRGHFVDFGDSMESSLDLKQANDLAAALQNRDVTEASATVGAGTIGGAGWPEEKWAIGSLHYLALTVPVDERWMVAIVAIRRHAAFNDQDLNVARRLVDDVRRALAFHVKAARSKGFAVGDRLFEARAIALIVTRHKMVEHTNEAAARLLERQGLLHLAGRSLRFDDVRVAAAFDELSKGAGRRASAKSLAFIVTDGRGESWLVQLSRHQTASASPLLADTANASQVVIALTPLAEASGSRGALIDGFVDLTPTERAVLSAFVDGKDIASIASEMRRSIETVRWHVRNLFAKLGVNSQADLTRLGSLLLPI
jgi:DNA-binding CsgD family transcriptional regulator